MRAFRTNTRRAASVIAVSLLATLAAPSAHAAIIFFDDFDEEPSSGLNYTTFDEWDVTAGTVDLFLNGGFSLPCPSLGCVDMDGSTNAAGTMETQDAFNLAAGDYALSINVAPNQRTATAESMEIFFSGTSLGTIDFSANEFLGPYSLEVFNFTLLVATSGTIEMAHAGGDNRGILVDFVQLESRTNGEVPVPEPGTLGLFGLSLIGLGLSARRRKLQSTR